MSLIYKIVPRRLWEQAFSVFAGTAVDLGDGFIHFSSALQVEETAARHFAGQRDLLLVAVDPVRLGPTLRWDVSRGGGLFPHLYAPLALDDVAWVKPLMLTKAGNHDFSGLLT